MLNAMAVRAGILAFAASISVSAYAIADAPRRIDIPAGDLALALESIAKQSGIELMYSSKQLEGARTPGLHGEFTPQDAVAKLLEGTKFRLTIHASGGLLISNADTKGSAGAPLPALAQVQPPVGSNGAVATPAAPETVEEVVVTAQKRTERLLDTPQAVSVISSDALARLGATQFRDFANTVPGLTFTTTGAGSNQISLRGVTTGVENNPTVGIYLDDVPVGSSTAFAFAARLAFDAALFDLDRVEVLRGPQGTLYGSSTMGGLLKYVSRRPDASKFGLDAQTGLSTTRDGDLNYLGSVTVNVPVAETAAVRASAFYSRDGGYIDNVARGQKDVDRSSIYGGRVNFLLTPSEDLEIELGAFLQNIERDGQASADYAFTGLPQFGELDQARLVAEPFDQRLRLVSGKVTYSFGAATLTSISAYQNMERDTVFDVSALFVPILQLPIFGGRTYGSIGLPDHTQTDKFTQELRLASDGAATFEWLVGAFYTHETSKVSEVFALRDVAGQSVPNTVFTFDNPTRYEEYAAFGDLTYHLTQRFDVSVGTRYAKNKQVFSQEGSGQLGTVIPTLNSSEGVFTYLANARYRVGDRSTAYVRYATGYRPGGANFTGFDPEAPLTFKADRLKSYEAGVRAETAERRFGIDFAGYYIDWRDIQLSRALGGFDNAGKAGIRGVELALTARPVRALALSSAIALQDAHLREAGPNLGGRKDERLPNVPRFTGTLNADYEFTTTGLRPAVGATVRYVSRREASFDGSANFPQYELPAYTSVDLRTSATINLVNVQLYAHNLFDRRGQLSAFNGYSTFGGPAQVSILQPRSIGISATMRY